MSKMLIEINSGWIEDLISCKRKVKDRDFAGWSIEALMVEAIREFKDKYGKNE